MTSPGRKSQELRKWLILLLKLGVTLLCFWYISGKIELASAGRALWNAKIGWVALAIALYIVSKWISAYRLMIYFRNIGLSFPQNQNLRLYWLGMFYNLFLPGSITGDAYKVILLHRRYKTPAKKLTAAVMLDRFSGLLALACILAGYGLWVLDDPAWKSLLVVGALGSVGLAYLAVRLLFPDFRSGFGITFLLGLIVQGVQVLCIYALMASLSIPLSQHAWVFIFLTASMVSVLPLSLGGGLGTRELVFVEGARIFHFDTGQALLISLFFYFTSLISAIGGAWFIFKDPLQDQIDQAPTGEHV